MAMGQGEQRAIHPFFAKGFGNIGSFAPVPSHRANVASRVVSLDGRSAEVKDPTSQSSVVEGISAQKAAELNPAGFVSPSPEAVLRQPDAPDEDPNASRRKRRKTDDVKSIVIPEDEVKPEGAGQSTESPDEVIISRKQSEIVPAVEEQPNSAPQRTLRLNPNGKLLSSPKSHKSEDKDSRTSRPRRGKLDRLSNFIEVDRKLAVVRYSNREGFGKLIDEVLEGRQRCPALDKPKGPVVVKAQPSKPTHPFFLKSTTRKSDTPSALREEEEEPHSAPQKDSASSGTQRDEAATGATPCPRPPSTPWKLLGFSAKRRPGFQEPVGPLWPPRHLVHVRDEDLHGVEGYGGHPVSLKFGRKKAKIAAVSISKQESVLLSCLQDAAHFTDTECSTGKTRPALRIPQKSVASGRTLQRALVNQLSMCSAASVPDARQTSHPAVVKLFLALPSAVSSFDRGESESQLWTQKYAPTNADDVLQSGRESTILRDWLRELTITAVDQGKYAKDEPAKRRKRRKKLDKLNGFIVSSGDEASEMDEVDDPDEDELAGGVTVVPKKTVVRSGDLDVNLRSAGDKGRLTNAILLSGPSGSGKTASVYAVAKELDFEVFEIGPGSRRSARDIVERVGDMTRNHLVHNLKLSEEPVSSHPSDTESSDQTTAPSSQGTMKNFLGQKAAGKPKKINGGEKKSRKAANLESDSKAPRSQKQSLILLEEVDLLFEEDKQFWSGVMTLIRQSKRPIILTCNDENLLPLEELSLHAILRYRPPTPDVAVDYMQLVAAHEGHMLTREAVRDLYASSNKNLRKSLMDLNFWCQMGVGSVQAGLDWIVDRWPPGCDVDECGDRQRAISLHTYEKFMGWFSEDTVQGSRPIDGEQELLRESLGWWQLTPPDSELLADRVGLGACAAMASSSMAQTGKFESAVERIAALRQEWLRSDMRSTFDLLSGPCSVDYKMDAIDLSSPPLMEIQRNSYIEGYPLLQADVRPDHTSLSASISTAFGALLNATFRPGTKLNSEPSHASRILASFSHAQILGQSKATLLAAFAPIMKPNYLMPLPTGRTAPSFENGLAPITEDLAPYIRSIVSFDLRLEQYRLQLSGLLSQGAHGSRNVRRTRASRAALEGGDKAMTRKERWFSPETNPRQILATGNESWQEILVQRGFCHVGPVREESSGLSEYVSDSSGQGRS